VQSGSSKGYLHRQAPGDDHNSVTVGCGFNDLCN
jgi:hypothetical protein